MQYRNVCLEAIGFRLPTEVVTSDEIEARLAPLYRRLRLPEGRLELISGIRERRIWPEGTMPSEMSAESARLALEAANFSAARVGALIHGSVCRDHLEPATACRVHHLLGLPAAATVFDLSNACLGLVNGLLLLANMIELGQIEAGIVTGTESSRSLLETTISAMNERHDLTRETIKPWLASLTIGSASVAMLLTHRSISRWGTHVVGGVAQANTRFHDLCQSGADEAVASGMQPLMDTDSEALMREGIETGVAAFGRFLTQLSWNRASIDRTICHQVGKTHRRLMLEALQLAPEKDHATYETLGNTGSAALPITLAHAIQDGLIHDGERVALLGIGSGINCVMVGLEWHAVPIAGS